MLAQAAVREQSIRFSTSALAYFSTCHVKATNSSSENVPIPGGQAHDEDSINIPQTIPHNIKAIDLTSKTFPRKKVKHTVRISFNTPRTLPRSDSPPQCCLLSNHTQMDVSASTMSHPLVCSFQHDHATAEAINHQACTQSSMHLPCVPIQDTSGLTVLPFPLLYPSWYKEQWRKVEVNKARAEARALTDRETDNEGCVMVVHHRRVGGSLQDNLNNLEQLCKLSSTPPKAKHLETLIELATYIEENGPLVSTQDVAQLYSKRKSLTSVTSAAMHEALSNHLNITQLYHNGKAYLIAGSSSNIAKLLETLSGVVNEQAIITSHVQSRLSEIYSDALRYLDTPRDREVLRGIMAKITSINFASKLEG